MSFLTITIIIAIVFIILTYMDHFIFDFPEFLGILALMGLPVDFVIIAICMGIRTGWIGFIISAIILVFIYFGIQAHQDSITEKSHEKWKKENNSKGEKLLEYMKVYYPQYKFDGFEAKITYNDYKLHSLDCKSVYNSILKGTMTVNGSWIKIRFYHPYCDYYDSKGAIQVFFKKYNTPNSNLKLEFDCGKICVVNDFFVHEIPISPRNALENCIINTARYLESIDAELTKTIYNH